MSHQEPNRPAVPEFGTPGEQFISCELFAENVDALRNGEIKDKLLDARLRGHAAGCPKCKEKLS